MTAVSRWVGSPLAPITSSPSRRVYARSYYPEPVEVSESSGARGLTIRLTRGGTIRGKVTGIDPESLTSITLRATEAEGRQWAQGSVDPSGEYRIENIGFSEGTIYAVSQSGGRRVTEEFTVDTEGGETWIDLEFKTGGSTLTGVVLIDGEPLTGGQVMARGGLESTGIGPVDSSGRFEIEGLEDGRYTLSIYLYSGTNISDVETVDVIGDSEVTLQIRSIRVTGRVVSADTGEPIAGAIVSIRRATDWYTGYGEETTTGSTGEFELRVAAEGKALTLQAQAEGFAQKSLPLDLSAGASTSGIELALASGSGDRARREDGLGTAPTGIGVAVLDLNGRIQYAKSLSSIGSGAYTLSSIPPGRWNLLVLAHGGAVVSTPITVPGPTVSVIVPPESLIEVDLTAVPGLTGSEKLRLLTPNGDPVPFPIGGGSSLPDADTRQSFDAALGAGRQLDRRTDRQRRPEPPTNGDDRRGADHPDRDELACRLTWADLRPDGQMIAVGADLELDNQREEGRYRTAVDLAPGERRPCRAATRDRQ